MVGGHNPPSRDLGPESKFMPAPLSPWACGWVSLDAMAAARFQRGRLFQPISLAGERVEGKPQEALLTGEVFYITRVAIGSQ